MPFEKNFIKMVETFGAIEHSSEAGPPYPFTVPPATKDLLSAIERGAHSMPLVYRKSYVEPLVANLSAVLERSQGDHNIMETLAGAAYQHAQPELAPALKRFLAVISNLFRSFLSNKRRVAADFPQVQSIPPLAVFQRSGALGPFTYTCDDIARYTGGQIGVVSLPAAYSLQPLLWSTLAHETGGHDVIHSDKGLITEMEEGAKSLFGGDAVTSSRKLTHEQSLGIIWSYWMEESSADAYAILNMGPLFAINASAFCAALVSQGKLNKPRLRTESIFDSNDPAHTFDSHSTDIVRLSLFIGVIESLAGLAPPKRSEYINLIQSIEKLCAPGTTTIKLKGIIDGHAGAHFPIDLSIPMDEMRHCAKKIGAYIVTTHFRALADKTIQDLETWDDFDESVAVHVSELLTDHKPAAAYGDDAQLLAGANMAVLNDGSTYKTVVPALEESLDQSFETDPFWAPLRREHSHSRHPKIA